MEWIQVLFIVIAFLATGLSQFVEIKKNKSSGNFFQKFTVWGKTLFLLFIASLLLSVIFALKDIRENKESIKTFSTIAESLKHERELSLSSDSARLKGSIDLLGNSYLSIWIYPPFENMSVEDSVSLRSRLLDFTREVLSEMQSQSNNVVLLRNQNLYAFWNSVRASVLRERLTLYGYNFTSLKRVNQVLQLVGTRLREMEDNYSKEGYLMDQKTDTNLYPIIKNANDSAWIN